MAQFALQLYTLRDSFQTPAEFSSLLADVKALGFAGVELAGSGGLSAEQLKGRLDELGLDAVCSHEMPDRLANHLDEVIAFHQTIGCTKIAIAWSPAASEADLTQLFAVVAQAKPALATAGIELLYHNHDHEFKTIGSEQAIEQIARHLALEVDTYWVFSAGQDVPAWLMAHQDQIRLLHIKDGDRERHPCALGEGENTIDAILTASERLGLDWLIVENDNPVPDGLSDVARSMAYLKTVGRL
ncbi:MAG: sugar phosphate isomerase/epimerase [Eubacteriales bacterium]|nr:sugar phosphate isomerase/epimerase [Eubacteriales bacterium]